MALGECGMDFDELGQQKEPDFSSHPEEGFPFDPASFS
jgi:hypothetical protein